MTMTEHYFHAILISAVPSIGLHIGFLSNPPAASAVKLLSMLCLLLMLLLSGQLLVFVLTKKRTVLRLSLIVSAVDLTETNAFWAKFTVAAKLMDA